MRIREREMWGEKGDGKREMRETAGRWGEGKGDGKRKWKMRATEG